MTGHESYKTRITAELLSSKGRSFDSYFKVYDDLVARSDLHILQIEDVGPEDASPISHDDILVAAATLRENPRMTLSQARQHLAARLAGVHSAHQLKFAIFVAVRAMIMLDCAPGGQQSESWQPGQRFVDFVSECFPKALGLSETEAHAMEGKNSLKAWKLKARLGISFRGTDNLSRHLLLDALHPEGPTIYLFHHTSFLKAQLERLQREGYGRDNDVTICLLSGCLSPRLLAETLHSLQGILFQFDDRRSSGILQRLISKGGFDEDCARPEGYKMFDNAEKFDYRYWGHRLAVLHGFVQGRPPKNKFERWFKWQTSESNAFAVALAALLISIVVGILTLGLSGFQAWVAWKAWKEPVSGSQEISISLEDLMELIRQQGGR